MNHWLNRFNVLFIKLYMTICMKLFSMLCASTQPIWLAGLVLGLLFETLVPTTVIPCCCKMDKFGSVLSPLYFQMEFGQEQLWIEAYHRLRLNDLRCHPLNQQWRILLYFQLPTPRSTMMSIFQFDQQWSSDEDLELFSFSLPAKFVVWIAQPITRLLILSISNRIWQQVYIVLLGG